MPTERTLPDELRHKDLLKEMRDYGRKSDSEYPDTVLCHHVRAWADRFEALLLPLRDRAEAAEQQVKDAEHRGRLEAFIEIHEHWEFEDDTEEVFDAWMHSRIKELRRMAPKADRDHAREELATLKAKWSGVKDGVDLDLIAGQMDSIGELKAELARLQPYVQHRDDCEKVKGSYLGGPSPGGRGNYEMRGSERCTCDLEKG